MDYNKIFSEFPVLEGEKIRLRKITSSDIPELFRLVQDNDVVQNYSAIGRYYSVDQAIDNFLDGPEINFKEHTSISWAIEDKESMRVVGVRELFFDRSTDPVTVQGFVGKEFRNMGLSKEAYKLIINFARNFDATAIVANTTLENYPAIALLYSVGFKQDHVFMVDNCMMVTFIHDLSDFDEPEFSNISIKKITIFCKMYIRGGCIKIIEDNTPKFQTDAKNIYKVSLIGSNTLPSIMTSTFGPSYHDIEFYSDGSIFKSMKDIDFVSSIDGFTRYSDVWHYIWKFCKKNNETF